MPVTLSAKKKLRGDKKKTAVNILVKRRLKKAIKTMRRQPTKKNLYLATSLLDLAAKKRVIHKNKAARLKSRLAKFLQSSR